MCEALWVTAAHMTDVALDDEDMCDLNGEFAFVIEEVAREQQASALCIDYFSRGLVSFQFSGTYARIEPAALIAEACRALSSDRNDMTNALYTAMLLTHTLVDSASVDDDLGARVWVAADWSRAPRQVPERWFERAFAIAPSRQRTLRWDGRTFMACTECGAWRHGNDEMVRAYEHVTFTCAQGLYARHSPCSSPNDPESVYEWQSSDRRGPRFRSAVSSTTAASTRL